LTSGWENGRVREGSSSCYAGGSEGEGLTGKVWMGGSRGILFPCSELSHRPSNSLRQY
jgi:hypothetical protein